MTQSTIFQVDGMHCTACASRLEKKLLNTKGIMRCSVNFASNTVLVEYNSEISEEQIIDAADSTGFIIYREILDKSLETSFKQQIFPLLSSWILVLILIVPMFIHPNMHSGNKKTIINIIISGFVIFVSGWNILKNAWLSLKSRNFGMDILIALGALSAWLSSILIILGIQIQDYSMTAAMLIAVNTTGRFLESMARGKASKSLTKLANFGAKTAFKILENSEILELPVSELEIGDHIQIKAGEKIPADGTIISGRTNTDESFLTGESLPIEKKEGDFVFGGSLNIDGFIKVRVDKSISQTLMAQTIRLVQQAQSTKVPIQILADNITSIFVPIILTLSFLSFAIWFAFPETIPNFLNAIGIPFEPISRLSGAISAGISVLVIACPCALGLATPMALVNGSALGATKGILIRNGAVVQTLNKTQVIALDKTGTLTVGKPKIISIFTDRLSEKETMGMLTGLEELSTHPLAHAVTTYSKEHNIKSTPFSSATNIPGQGIFGVYNNTEWFAGSLNATEELEITISETLQSEIAISQDKGETLVCLSNIDKKNCEAIVTFSDKIKPEAMEAIKTFKKMGKRIIMITGDHKKAALNVAKELNITSVISECSPKKKLETINSLKSQGYNVCFVGDGINDTAALEAADVGIAIGTGSDIATEAGDIILMSGSLTSLVSSFKLSEAIFSKIKQNLFWAFFYNTIAIPLAFLGLLHPVIGEIAMSISSLTVIGNSMLLGKTYKIN